MSYPCVLVFSTILVHVSTILVYVSTPSTVRPQYDPDILVAQYAPSTVRPQYTQYTISVRPQYAPGIYWAYTSIYQTVKKHWYAPSTMTKNHAKKCQKKFYFISPASLHHSSSPISIFLRFVIDVVLYPVVPSFCWPSLLAFICFFLRFRLFERSSTGYQWIICRVTDRETDR